MKLHAIGLPNGAEALLPDDVRLEFPDDMDEHALTPRQRCSMAYIPWDDAYLRYVPGRYRAFFRHALPYMGVRTTDVHTALSVAQLPSLFAATDVPVDRHVIYLALILHDTGWSRVDAKGLADSLSFSGMSLSEAAHGPKQLHLAHGAVLAAGLLDSFDFAAHHDRPLTDGEKRHIIEIISRHDQDAPWEQGKYHDISLETDLVCDADRLWSYTHLNFWQDTVRKHIPAADYLVNVTGAVDSYFFTPQGKTRARQLLRTRQAEVAEYYGLAAQRPQKTVTR